MIRILIILLAVVVLFSCRKSESIDPSFYDCTFGFADSSLMNPGNSRYQDLLDSLTSSGVVGMTLSVYHPNTGIWIGAGGMADLANGVPMKACNISRVGSTVKMFTATTVLLLAEEGKFSLDDRIADYVDNDVTGKLENADVATIRQLLQHSSGIYNYIWNLQFQTASTNDLIREWHAEDLLKYAWHQPAGFEPGTDVSYSNTNYILLGMLIEAVEGKPFYKVFEEKLFLPLGLNLTRFAAENPVPPGIVRGYIDLYSNLQVIETTYYSGWDYYTADGGLISNPYDLSVFFRALMQGQVISQASLGQMLDWQAPGEQDPAFYEIWYGLGIFKMVTSEGVCYFHSGDAIGYYANMMYFPEDSTTIVYATNSNYGKIDALISTKEAMDHILSVTKD